MHQEGLHLEIKQRLGSAWHEENHLTINKKSKYPNIFKEEKELENEEGWELLVTYTIIWGMLTQLEYFPTTMNILHKVYNSY